LKIHKVSRKWEGVERKTLEMSVQVFIKHAAIVGEDGGEVVDRSAANRR